MKEDLPEEPEIPRLIPHPLSTSGRAYPITTVLLDLAAQEGCDGEPYDIMVATAHYIEDLEVYVKELEAEILRLNSDRFTIGERV